MVNLIEICRTKGRPPPLPCWQQPRLRRVVSVTFPSLSVVSTATLYNRYKGSIYLVFDFCEHDLAGLLSNSNVKFTLAEIKKVMQMLLNGLYYIHRNKVRRRRETGFFSRACGCPLTVAAGVCWADPSQRHESGQRAHHPGRRAEAGRLWTGPGL